jgi:FtsZ-binding cell division protein ZapB
LVQAQDIIKQRDEKIASFDGDIKAMLSDISNLKDENEKLKREAAEAEKLRNALKQENL